MPFKVLSDSKIRQILSLHKDGFEKKEIAKRLHVSYSAVNRHINAIRKDSVPNSFYSIDAAVAVSHAVSRIRFLEPALGRPSWFEEKLNIRAGR